MNCTDWVRPGYGVRASVLLARLGFAEEADRRIDNEDLDPRTGLVIVRQDKDFTDYDRNRAEAALDQVGINVAVLMADK